MFRDLFSRRGRKSNKSSQPSLKHSFRKNSLRLETLEDRLAPAAPFSSFVDPNPAPGNQFGAQIVPLSSGNVVITSPGDDAGGSNAGAVYLFNGSTGTLLSTLRGSSANDQIGSLPIIVLNNGNFLVRSPSWDNAGVTDAGAVTWGSRFTGVSGSVGSGNSLVGSSAFDQVGSAGVTLLKDGHYLVRSPFWNNGAVSDAGAVTWGNGLTGVSGAVNSGNSLVSDQPTSLLGNASITILTNSNYVVNCPTWKTSFGSATWGDYTTGVSGVITSGNSLVGNKANDQVGFGGITPLTNGNYVVNSYNWNATALLPGSVSKAGAVTWGSGTAGITGEVSSSNSLVGTRPNDQVGGEGVTALSGGNYVVSSPTWDNTTVSDAGAVTLGNGVAGTTGEVSSLNSLVGSSTNDMVGGGPKGITVLSNGNFVVRSLSWDNGGSTDAGAVTLVSGTAAFTGAVDPSNSLVGSFTNDRVGSGGITPLGNGAYVVTSPLWDNGIAADAGAVTWGNSISGVTGPVSVSNSLVGSTSFDQVGLHGITKVKNNNFVVVSRNWDNGPVQNAGAVTWGSGASGITGVVSSSNSLVGSTNDDRVGEEIVALSSGNYVVNSYLWDNGGAADAGAVTFGSGTSGISGVVGAANSLVGTTANDQVGIGGITSLGSGNYIVNSYFWDNGGAVDAGAVTWCSGLTGLSGPVTSTNSLVGGTSSSQVGAVGITALKNGNYVVNNPNWDNGSATKAGAVTFGNGNSGVSGVVGVANSLVGSTADDKVGNFGVTPLNNGNYVVSSPDWTNGSTAKAGAVTLGNGTSGITGPVSASNSLVGGTANDQVGSGGVTPLSNNNYVVSSPGWANGALTNAGAVTWGSGTTGIVGLITGVNSAVGTSSSSNLQPVVLDNTNQTIICTFLNQDGGTVSVGSQSDGFTHPPTAIQLSNNTVPENSSIGSLVGLFSSTDANPGDTFTYSLVGGLGSSGNSSFSISGNQLLVDALFDYETKNSYLIRVRTTDASGLSCEANFSILITNQNDNAPVAVADSYSTNEDVPLVVPAPGVLANDTDTDGSPLTAVLVTGPSHGTLTLNADGSFTYTPDGNFHGSDSFTYRASDGVALSNVATVSITVNPINDAPVANDDSYSTNEDAVLNVPAPGVLANDTDVEGSPLTAILVSGTSHGSLTLNADGSFSYTPSTNFFGLDSFTYKANDGSLDSNVATVTITVNPVNDAPVAVDDGYTTSEETLLDVPAPGVLSNDADVESSPLTAILVSGTSHGSLTLNADGSFSYTPNTDFTGTDSFTYKANDGSLDSNVATVTITVTPINDAPTLAPISDQTIDEDAPQQTVNLTGISAGGGESQPIRITATSSNTGLIPDPTVVYTSPNSTGSLLYTPVANQNGTTLITVVVEDGGQDGDLDTPGDNLTATQTFTITVNPVNDAPVANNDSYSVNEDGSLNVSAPGVLSNDSDPVEGSSLTAILVTSTTNGSLTLNTDGSFSYTPNANFFGTDSFTYKVNDGTSDSNVATVTITVNAVNDRPTFTGGPNQEVLANSPRTVVGWATNISAGPSNESSQTLAFIVTTDNNSLFNVLPAISPTGTLTLTAGPVAGTAIVTVVLTDNGGTANGGLDASLPQTFIVTVKTPI